LLTSILLYIGSIYTRLWWVKRQQRLLKEEQQETLKGIKEMQAKTFLQLKMHMGEYQQSMDSHHKKLAKNVRKRIELQSRENQLKNFWKSDIERLKLESEMVQEQIKEAQKKYLDEKSMQTPVYHIQTEELTSRLTTIESKIAELEAERTVSELIGWRSYLPESWKSVDRGEWDLEESDEGNRDEEVKKDRSNHRQEI
ncbi:MAG: hypothetical protein SVV03_05005, partial [Candidatus Nanohaloarchaea archaeon]|nr:hypothetical protein [Candidatus Nanohaloarchaea archaeon]